MKGFNISHLASSMTEYLPKQAVGSQTVVSHLRLLSYSTSFNPLCHRKMSKTNFSPKAVEVRQSCVIQTKLLSNHGRNQSPAIGDWQLLVTSSALRISIDPFLKFCEISLESVGS